LLSQGFWVGSRKHESNQLLFDLRLKRVGVVRRGGKEGNEVKGGKMEAGAGWGGVKAFDDKVREFPIGGINTSRSCRSRTFDLTRKREGRR